MSNKKERAKPEKVDINYFAKDYKKDGEAIQNFAKKVREEGPDVVRDGYDELTGQLDKTKKLLATDEKTVKAKFPVVCGGKCRTAYGYGATILKIGPSLICPECGGPLEEMEFR